MTRELSNEEKNKLAERIAQSVKRAPFRAGRFSLERIPLPFYKDAYAVHIKCFTTRPMITKKYICDDERVFETDGEKETLLKINKALSLKLDSENVVAYTAFYFRKVAIDDHFATLALTPDDIIDDNFNEELQETLETLVTAPQVRETEDGFIVSGFVLLEDTLFKADLKVEKNGSVSIDKEEIVYENLPINRIMLR
ncbi:MAG: hypothetical protein J5787_02415 [Alphaproteobacteria bacterium]|nr:hypothetical protein [Alphaproteobacteria bacterium]